MLTSRVHSKSKAFAAIFMALFYVSSATAMTDLCKRLFDQSAQNEHNISAKDAAIRSKLRSNFQLRKGFYLGSMRGEEIAAILVKLWPTMSLNNATKIVADIAILPELNATADSYLWARHDFYMRRHIDVLVDQFIGQLANAVSRNLKAPWEMFFGFMAPEIEKNLSTMDVFFKNFQDSGKAPIITTWSANAPPSQKRVNPLELSRDYLLSGRADVGLEDLINKRLFYFRPFYNVEWTLESPANRIGARLKELWQDAPSYVNQPVTKLIDDPKFILLMVHDYVLQSLVKENLSRDWTTLRLYNQVVDAIANHKDLSEKSNRIFLNRLREIQVAFGIDLVGSLNLNSGI